MKVGVLGAAGRMGSEVVKAVEVDDDLELVAVVDSSGQIRTVADSGAQVAVDFTTPQAVMDNIRFCVNHGIHCVVGTSGITSDDRKEIESWTGSTKANVFIAPNFAIGAVLMMELAARAATHFDSAEIIERHHERKLDAPSGTALRTAELMNDRRGRAWKSPADDNGVRPEPRGLDARGLDVGGLKIHSLRVAGSVAHQEVILGSPGETLTIRHDSLDRASFMPGVLLAIKKVASLPGLTFGLENLIDL